MFDRWWEKAPDAATVVDRVRAAVRAENQAAGAKLAAIGELDVLRARDQEPAEEWTVDNAVSVSAEMAAILGVAQGLAASYLYYARAMRSRLPLLGAALLAGDIGYLSFQAMVYRTDLVHDPDIVAAVDAELALKASRWPSMTRGRLNAAVDRIVARRDPDAVRRRREAHTDREVSIWESNEGLSEMFGRLVTTDAQAVDARLDALAATVCHGDPRTRSQRRADALGALAVGAQRLGCRCGRTDCPAGAKPAPGPVLVHVIAEQAALDGRADTPGVVIGADALIPAQLLAELAATAKYLPLVVPVDAAPEPGYRPSKALADFVRCRDLTCRWSGCDVPADQCDIDHTTPYNKGGRTHASNLKCLCRTHHLVKTFWGWKDQQLPDGTVIWTAPTGQTYVSTPGSAWLFPSLCVPTGELAATAPPTPEQCGQRTAMMPKRRHTRAANRARYIATERRRNRQARQARQARQTAQHATQQGPGPPPDGPDEPPPF